MTLHRRTDLESSQFQFSMTFRPPFITPLKLASKKHEFFLDVACLRRPTEEKKTFTCILYSTLFVCAALSVNLCFVDRGGKPTPLSIMAELMFVSGSLRRLCLPIDDESQQGEQPPIYVGRPSCDKRCLTCHYSDNTGGTSP